MNIKCFFGFHKWKDDPEQEKGSGMEICERCPKKRLVIHAIMYSDYLDFPDDVKEKYKDKFVF